MELDKQYTKDQLVEKGWRFVDYFGNSQIWKKEDDFLLWNASTHFVELIFEEEICA